MTSMLQWQYLRLVQAKLTAAVARLCCWMQADRPETPTAADDWSLKATGVGIVYVQVQVCCLNTKQSRTQTSGAVVCSMHTCGALAVVLAPQYVYLTPADPLSTALQWLPAANQTPNQQCVDAEISYYVTDTWCPTVGATCSLSRAF
jgi:predicted naringenin-chalcone synthase